MHDICKKSGKQYPCDSLEIDYFKSGYTTIEGKTKIIDFSNLNNNCEYIRQIFWTIDSLLN